MAKEGYGLEITELRLGLPGGGSSNLMEMKNVKKRVFSEVSSDRNSSTGEEITERKSQVVGWPPVCLYRRKNNFSEIAKKYIKVSMDGAPILRKIDLSTHVGYDDLAKALEKLFGTCYGIVDAFKGRGNSEYVPVYEDKDGDWMLVGDVPWEMFTESCKRLRIMKRSEAKGMDLQLKCFIQGAPKNE